MAKERRRWHIAWRQCRCHLKEHKKRQKVVSQANSYTVSFHSGECLQMFIPLTCGQGIVPEVKEGFHFVFGNRNGFATTGLRHERRVVMDNLPFAIFKDVDKGVSGFGLGARCAHGEFIQSHVLAPLGPRGDVTFQNDSLRLHCQKEVKVVLNGRVISTRSVGDSWQQHCLFCVALGHDIRIHCM